jgi:ABC-type nitrate/sulfonate/bicarbonate transport system permease component
MPTVITVSPVPVLAWIPLLITLVGISSARTALCAIGTFFTMFFGTIHGMQQVDGTYLDLARSLNKSRLATLWHVLLPGAMPAIFHSLRLSLATGWILILAGEVIASSSGLGWLIWDARNFQRPADLFAAIVTIGVIGAIADSSVLALQRWMLRWQTSEE